MKKPILRLVLRLILLQTVIGLVGIVVAMALGQPLSQGIVSFVHVSSSTQHDIWVVDVATRIKYNLVHSLYVDFMHTWSADGTRLIFSRVNNDERIVFMVDANGRNLQQITDATEGASSPVLSPDGRHLAYVATNNDGSDLRILDLQTNTSYRVTPLSIHDFSPVWSPDGTMLAFGGRTYGSEMTYPVGIYVLEMAHLLNPAQGLTRIGDFTSTFFEMSWSFDSQYLTFTYVQDATSNADIALIDVTTSVMTVLVNTPAAETDPALSPDGTILIFSSGYNGNPNIYVLNLITGEPHPLTHDGLNDIDPVWSPDGERIVYMSADSDPSGLYVIDIAGGEPWYLAPAFLRSGVQWRPG